MTNVRKIRVDWYGQQPPRFTGGPQLAYQGDHLSNMVVFDNAPELPNYYLIVKMKTDDAGPVDTLPAIMLEGPYWVIPNYYTQVCQQITYQVCCKTETGDYEHHSAEFKGTILPVITHNGEPIDQSPMFDPYIDILDKRVNELIVAAGDIQIDSELKSDSGNPVQNRVVKAAIDGLEDDVDAVNGRLTEQGEIVDRLNEGGLDIKDDVIEAQITDWLNDHPEATTTVQDGSITESKFSASVKKTVDASKIRDLVIDSVAFMNFYKTGYTSLQGVCALDERHIVVVRYLPNDERSFSVWDINSQSFVAESIFTDAQVGHCNTITYAEPYIYVTALSSGNKVVRLLVDSETKEITYDSDVYTGSAYPHCVAYSGGHFYCLREANNTFTLTVTDDFQNFTTLETSSFDNGAYLTAQGMAVYGDLVFIAFSTSFRYTGTDVTSERIPLQTEAIYVTDKNLNVLKTSFYSRGKWGEIEGCDVMVVSGQAYLLVGSNVNDAVVSGVHALPIFNDTEQLEVFYACKVIGGPYKSEGAINFYVDSAYDSPFAKGTKSSPFGSIPIALTVARQIDAPVVFNITGTFPGMGVRWFKNPIYLNITDSTITAVEITHCNNVHLKCSDVTFGQMKIESSTVMAPTGPSMEKMDESVTNAIMIYRSFVTGNIKYIGAFNNGLSVFASVLNVYVTTSEASKLVTVVTPSLAYVDGAIQ